MSLAEYQPWSEIHDVDVLTPWAHQLGVDVPYVRIASAAAATPEAVMEVLQIAALVTLSHAGCRLQQLREEAALADAEARVFEHPLAHLLCLECQREWHAWTTEDGHLQDPRDLYCSDGHAPKPAVEVREG